MFVGIPTSGWKYYNILDKSQARSGAIELKGDFVKETMWASLNEISKIFETDNSGISRHIKNIYESGELKQKATVAKFATVHSISKCNAYNYIFEQLVAPRPGLEPGTNRLHRS